MELTERFEWRGRQVAWNRRGEGPALVFCHGTPWSSWLWESYADALANEFTVYLWDMPGYGRSSMLAEHEVDLETQGRLFTDLLQHWDLSTPHVVAHDFGGAVSLRALILHGAQYASLCLVDVVALRPWGSAFFRLVHDHAEVFGELPVHVHRGAVEAYVRGASHVGLTDEQLERLVAPWATGEGQAAFYRQIAQADEQFTDEIQDRYEEIDLPVHVIWGADDDWIPSERGRELAAAIPGATLEVIDGAGHLIQLDAPSQLATALHRWLSGVAAV